MVRRSGALLGGGQSPCGVARDEGEWLARRPGAPNVATRAGHPPLPQSRPGRRTGATTGVTRPSGRGAVRRACAATRFAPTSPCNSAGSAQLAGLHAQLSGLPSQRLDQQTVSLPHRERDGELPHGPHQRTFRAGPALHPGSRDPPCRTPTPRPAERGAAPRRGCWPRTTWTSLPVQVDAILAGPHHLERSAAQRIAAGVIRVPCDTARLHGLIARVSRRQQRSPSRAPTHAVGERERHVLPIVLRLMQGARRPPGWLGGSESQARLAGA